MCGANQPVLNGAFPGTSPSLDGYIGKKGAYFKLVISEGLTIEWCTNRKLKSVLKASKTDLLQ
jgi:hypothetical protein